MVISGEQEGEKRGSCLYPPVRLFTPSPVDPEVQMHPSLMPSPCYSSGWEQQREYSSTKHLILQSLEICSAENIQIFLFTHLILFPSTREYGKA